MQEKSMSGDEASGYLNDALDKLEQARLEALEKAKHFHLIRHVQMEDELKRLNKKYGAGNARSKKIESGILFNRSMFSALDLHIGLTKSHSEAFDPDTWRVQGFISGENNISLANLAISIAVENAEPGKDPKVSYTDQFGFYSITLEKEIVEKLKDAKIFLQVSDRDKKVIHTENNLLTPVIGVIDIENILIPEKEQKGPKEND